MTSFGPHSHVQTKEQERTIRLLLMMRAPFRWIASLLLVPIFALTLAWGVPHGSFIEPLNVGVYINPLVAAAPEIVSWLKLVLPGAIGHAIYDAFLVAFGVMLLCATICSLKLESLRSPAMSPVCWAGREANNRLG